MEKEGATLEMGTFGEDPGESIRIEQTYNCSVNHLVKIIRENKIYKK